ncbi:MAG TPA: hypothetical protein VGI36_20205 [Candidatus Binataceae bacterium]|jgi:hypothetical protein
MTKEKKHNVDSFLKKETAGDELRRGGEAAIRCEKEFQQHRY